MKKLAKSSKSNHRELIRKTHVSTYFMGEIAFCHSQQDQGKSIVFQAFPYVYDMVHENNNPSEFEISSCRKVILVISPITTLMQDQVNILSKKGIKAIHLVEKKEQKEGVGDVLTHVRSIIAS